MILTNVNSQSMDFFETTEYKTPVYWKVDHFSVSEKFKTLHRDVIMKSLCFSTYEL